MSDADENLREKNMKEWVHLTKNSNFDFFKFMTTESAILQYKSEGLPGDSLSIENSLMIFNTSKVPLLIDPNTQASEWLKTHLAKEKNIEILNQQDSKFTTQLELSIRFGKTLVIQELDFIEPVLFPVLRKDLIQQGPRVILMMGEKAVDYNVDFRLFLSTRNSFIDIQPSEAGLLSIINFTVTKSGLEGKFN